MPGSPPTLRRILGSALAALTVGLGAASLIAGFSDSFAVRLLQGLAVFAAGAVIIGGAVVLAMIRLAGWREPESEDDFEALVQRAERLAAEDSWGDSEDYDGRSTTMTMTCRPAQRGGLQGARRARRSTSCRSSSTARSSTSRSSSPTAAGARRAYGLYQGDTVARDFFHDRIVIFRDTLAAGLRPRSRAAEGAGHPHRAPRARPPPRLGREGRPRARALDARARSRRLLRRPSAPATFFIILPIALRGSSSR